MKNYSHFQLVIILMSFVISFAFGLDVYIPILPQMTQIFNTTPALVQLTMSLFLFTVGVGQLIIGPLSDQFGRQKVLIVCSCFFCLGSLACTFSTHIWWLISMRVIAGIGACGMLVTSFAVVRDLVAHDESAKVYSFLNGATGASPTFAPILGGYLAAYWGWQSVFICLAFLGLYSLFVSCYFIKETLEPAKRVKLNRGIFQRYLQIYKNRQFLTYSLMAGFAQAVFFGFFSISPFIIIDLLEVPAQHFGYYFAVFGLVLSLGGLASGQLVEKVGVFTTLKIGVLLMLFGGLLMLAWSTLAPLSLWSFLAPMAIACTGAIFLVGSSVSVALEPFPSIAGTASAAFGCLEFGICSCVGASLMFFPIDSAVPYGICIVLMALLSGMLFVTRPQSLELTVINN